MRKPRETKQQTWDTDRVSYAFNVGKTGKEAIASRGDWYSSKEDKIAGELENISQGVSPYQMGGDGIVGVKDAIVLCQKAYWNVSIFRSTIDIQTEFSNSKLHFRSTNKRVAKFFEKWYNEKIGGWYLSERFFREWFRSGNVFLFKFNAELNASEYRKFTRASTGNASIPMRYAILNPADIKCLGGASFVNADYGKLLNSYELARLKNPKTKEEKEFFDSLDDKSKKAIKSGTNPIIKLNQEDLVAVFCGKQDYEAMAIPMYYPVLPDIDLKLEFKKAEKVLARTIDYAVLLVTAGDQEDKKKNRDILEDLTELFAAESTGRVVVADYTTKAAWHIPDLNKIFGAEKFQVVNQDIQAGLMSIFTGEGDKFSSTFIKTQIFLERLNQAREAYLNHFLIPEMKKIAETLSFTEIPTCEFEQIDLRDEMEMKKLYVQLAGMGVLTPDETFTAIKEGLLPLPEDSVVNQENFKKLKDKGLYDPLLGGPKKDEGRPVGSKAPQKTKKTSPVGASIEKYSLSQVGNNLKEFYSFVDRVETAYKDKHQILRLSKKNKSLCKFIAENIAINQTKDAWDVNIERYLENPHLDGDPAYSDKVLTISAEHNISPMLGAILANSVIVGEIDDN